MATKSDDPLYARLARLLRDRIGAMQPGDRIGSEPSLAREFDVSRVTVARAIEELVRDGLVVRRKGSGTYVSEQLMRRMPGALMGFAESVAAAGQHSLQQLRGLCPTEWRPDYPYAAGTALCLLDRLRLVQGRRIAWHRSVLPKALIEETGLSETVAAAPDFSLYRHLAAHGHRAVTAQETFHARLAHAEEIALLELPQLAAVVSVTRTSRDGEGRVIDFVRALYDARSYSFRADLARAAQPAPSNIPEEVSDAHQNRMGRQHGPRPDLRRPGPGRGSAGGADHLAIGSGRPEL